MGCRLPLTEGHQQPLGVERGAGPRKRHGAAARHTRGEKGEVSGPQGQTARVCVCVSACACACACVHACARGVGLLLSAVCQVANLYGP